MTYKMYYCLCHGFLRCPNWAGERKALKPLTDQVKKIGEICMKSTDAQIKTGLRLSEAIKLLEESPGALITIHDSTYDWLTYDYLFNSSLAVIYKKSLWSVKLPPPMPPRAVSVTRTDVFDAVESTDISMLPHKELAEKLCRKLGL